MAREFSAIFNRELCDGGKLKEITADIKDSPKKIVVEKSSCGKAYLGLAMKGVTIKPSSQKIQTRLKLRESILKITLLIFQIMSCLSLGFLIIFLTTINSSEIRLKSNRCKMHKNLQPLMRLNEIWFR